MACPTLNNISLSKKGEDALRDIKYAIKWSRYLGSIMVGSTLFSVLISDRAIPIVFGVPQTDWATLAQAIQSMSSIEQGVVKRNAGLMALESSGEEKVFWSAMYELCY